jgi:SAM-dependent methyltransferase
MSSETTDYVKTYTLDNGYPGERDRLRLVEAAWDPGSTAHFERLGVREGWNVLMVAGGGGSLVEWMAQRVGPTGRVVATDLDPRFLRPLADRYENLEVREHNVVTDPLPRDAFDLVHTRLLVAHLPQRVDVIAKMAVAAKPGGLLMIEDFDSASFGPAYPSEASEKVRQAAMSFLAANGYDGFTGRRLPGWLRQAGLVDVDAAGSVLTLRGSSTSLPQMYLAMFRQTRQRMVEMGVLSEADADGLERRYGDPEYDSLAHTMMTVWGRRP